MQRRATTGLLAAIAVLLAANLVVQSSTPTEAQPNPQYEAAPRVMGMAYGNSDNGYAYMHRIWSDGVIERRRVQSSGVAGSNWCYPGGDWSPINETCQ